MTTPQAPYGGYPPYGRYPARRQTNALAVVSLVCAFVFAPLGILFGHIALSQIKKTREDGRGLALAGLITSYVFTVFAVVAVVTMTALFFLFGGTIQSALVPHDHSNSTETNKPPHHYLLPAFAPPGVSGANCQYPATGEAASKPAKPPRTGRVPTDPGQISASMATNQGNIGLKLDNEKSPCTVNNFASLAQQGFFDNTPCHRLTTAKQLGVLQCGDPSGTGTGGPGYRFPSEYPTNQYKLSDPILTTPEMIYPRGTLAMANAGPGTNGSQFFLVYKDSVLPATYTVFGRIDETGLSTLDKIAKGGVLNGADDGKPARNVTVTSVRLD